MMDYFPNATFLEWLWTLMNAAGLVVSAVNAFVIYTRGRRVVKSTELIVASRAVGLLFVQRVIRSNILGFITTLFTMLGATVILASNDVDGSGIGQAVGLVAGVCLFLSGALITAYQMLEMAMRPEIDAAIEKAMLTDGLVVHDWNGEERRRKG